MSLDLSFETPRKPYVRPRLIPSDELDMTLKLPAFTGWKRVSWQEQQNRVEAIEKDFKFGRFIEAIDFMASLVTFCEDIQHHPAWANDHKNLRVCLTTHSIGKKVSAYDLALAEELNRAFAKQQEV